MRFRVSANLMLLTLQASTVVLFGQSGSDWITALQGNKVQLKIDMPGSRLGVDVRANGQPAVDWSEVNNRLQLFGTAIRKGQVSTITGITDTGRLLEVQLDGGGAAITAPDQVCVAEDLHHRERDLDEQRSRLKTGQELSNVELELQRVRSEMRSVQAECVSRRAGVMGQAGSRFRIHYGPKMRARSPLTEQTMRSLLAEYVEFSVPAAQVR